MVGRRPELFWRQIRTEFVAVVQVRAHVKKDDGRMQAYGWSLPARQPAADSAAAATSSGGKSPSEETQVMKATVEIGKSLIFAI